MGENIDLISKFANDRHKMKLTVAVVSAVALIFANPAFGVAVREPGPSIATPEASTGPTSTTTSSTPVSAAVTCDNRTKFKFFGVNQSGAEFGNQNIPGVLGTDYTWPSPSSIDVRTAA